jgi:hypothetical protein
MIGAMTNGTAATARGKDEQLAAPKQLANLMACRANVDATSRLTCFDHKIADLDRATQSGEVIITDRVAVQSAKRGLFGFAAPAMRLAGFGSPSGADELKEIQTKVSQVSRTRDGELRLMFDNDGVWEQNDTKTFVLTPRPGNAAKITRGTLGSYFVSVSGQHAIKMRRVQ